MPPSSNGRLAAGIAPDGKLLDMQVDASGALITAAAAPANPALAPATSANQATQIGVEQAMAADIARLANRQYDKFEQAVLNPGDSLTLPAGTWHSCHFMVSPIDRTAPDYNDYAKVVINGNGVVWYATQGDTLTATELSVVDVDFRADQCTMHVTWSF